MRISYGVYVYQPLIIFVLTIWKGWKLDNSNYNNNYDKNKKEKKKRQNCISLRRHQKVFQEI